MQKLFVGEAASKVLLDVTIEFSTIDPAVRHYSRSAASSESIIAHTNILEPQGPDDAA